MKKILAIALCLAALALCGAAPAEENGYPVATIEMEDGGTMVLELYPDIAPNTVANFIELANAVDLNNREKRGKDYIRIRDRYKPDEFSRFGEVFCLLVESLERNPFQDFLGGMYMELNMGSKAHGQCFTPFGVCQAMAAMAMPEEQVRQQLDERGWISINDCACGAGATLIAAAERLYQMGINYQQSALFVAGDIDSTVAMMCFIQLALIGCAGRIRIGDALMNPETGPILTGNGGPNTLYLPMFYSPIWSGRLFAWRMDRILQGFREGQPATPEVIPEKIKPEEPKMPETALELVTAKRTKRSMSEGQLMFDLTGGM